jgi:hypothetical protein
LPILKELKRSGKVIVSLLHIHAAGEFKLTPCYNLSWETGKKILAFYGTKINYPFTRGHHWTLSHMNPVHIYLI